MRFDNPGTEYNAGYNAESTRLSWKECLEKYLNRFLSYIRSIRWANMKSTKFLLTTITSIFTITAFVLLILGIVILVKCIEYQLFVGDAMFLLSRLVIATAVIMFFIAILGFYGAKTEKYKYVLAYTVLLVAILILEIAITVFAFDMEKYAHEDILYRMQHNDYFSRYHVREAWDNMHRALNCCSFSRNNWNSYQMPISCCRVPNGALSPFVCKPYRYGIGYCNYALYNTFTNDSNNIGIAGATFTCFQVIIIAIAAWMAYRLKHRQEIPFNQYANKKPQINVPPNPVVVDYSKY